MWGGGIGGSERWREEEGAMRERKVIVVAVNEEVCMRCGARNGFQACIVLVRDSTGKFLIRCLKFFRKAQTRLDRKEK